MKSLFNKNKNSKLVYYIRNSFRDIIPRFFYNNQLNLALKNSGRFDQEYIYSRVKYYLKHQKQFILSDNAISIKDFHLKGHRSMYYYDLKGYLHAFNSNLKFDYLFGDITNLQSTATLLKSRPIHGKVENSVLMNLEKLRHFNFIKDKLSFSDKINKVIWRE